jgi:hypothetical protein
MLKIKLNPEKCTFGVPSSKLLGYIVSVHGNETNPMKLMGCLASLSQFISR